MNSEHNRAPYPFTVEWLPSDQQFYHGPRKRMREALGNSSLKPEEVYSESQVLEHIIQNYPRFVLSIEKVKFYRCADRNTEVTFFILWIDYDLEAREVFFEESFMITARTGWYPVVTGHRIFHHKRHLLDFVDTGLRKAMNKKNIEALPGFGVPESIISLSHGDGTCVLLKTSTYDIVLDSGMTESELCLEHLRPNKRKIIFVSHSHRDHTGGLGRFLKDKNVVFAIGVVTLELLLNTVSKMSSIETYLPEKFFYRLAPMWYRTKYSFSDGSSVEVLPTYHFPGSMGFLFRFSDGRTLLYSGDLNISAAYLSWQIEKARPRWGTGLSCSRVDYALLDGAFVGRAIGSQAGVYSEILESVRLSLRSGRIHILLAPPADYGLFLFLYFYDHFVARGRDGEEPTRMFLDTQIIGQLEVLEWRFKRKQVGSLDDALLTFLEKRATLGESVRVFSMDKNLRSNLEELYLRQMTAVFILDDSRCDDPNYFSEDMLSCFGRCGVDVSRIGKAATRKCADKWAISMDSKDYDSGIWLLHSQEEVLKDHLLSGVPDYGKVVLFHNFPKRIERFSKNMKSAGYAGEVSSLSCRQKMDLT